MVSRYIQIIKKIYESILETIYSRGDRCILCKEYSEESLCVKCKGNIKTLKIETLIKENGEEFLCYSMGYYSYTIKKLILALKFHKDFEAGFILAEYMSNIIKREFIKDIDFITYIPSSKESLKKRGFNQCLFLAKTISDSCGIPCLNILERAHEVKDQIGLNDTKRWENIEGAFQVKGNIDIKGKRILIVDDVITTGATVYYAARAIMELKPEKVSILTAAKSRV